MSETEQPTKSYYGIITANVRYDKRLTANEKLFYSEITALCNEKGYCWATNGYFAKLYDVEKETISRWISKLQKCGYIRTQIVYKEGTKEVEQRRIYIAADLLTQESIPLDLKINTPIDLNVKDNIKDKNRERGEHAKTDSPIEVETTNKGLRGIAANQSAKQKLDEYLDAIREFYGGALGDEFRWGNACIKAIEKGFTSGELIAALTALMSQPRKFQITPENVLQFASETRVRERLLAEQQPKTYSGSPLIPDEIKEKLRQAQENYYAGI